jgi:hypothetical protein
MKSAKHLMRTKLASIKHSLASLCPAKLKRFFRLEREWREVHEANTLLLRQIADLKREAQYYRAQLCQLRIQHAEEHKRMGWMVSAFIPEEVIDSIKASGNKNEFVLRVAGVLVDSALRGIFRLNRTGKKVQALVFEPLSLDSQKALVSVWRDGDQRPDVLYSQSIPPAQLKKVTLATPLIPDSCGQSEK